MTCYCCNRDMTSARKVRLRPWRTFDPRSGGRESPAYQSYCEEMTFRWAVICQACYSTLDNVGGLAEVGGDVFNLAGASRGDKATTIDEQQHGKFRREEAAKLGLEPGDVV